MNILVLKVIKPAKCVCKSQSVRCMVSVIAVDTMGSKLCPGDKCLKILMGVKCPATNVLKFKFALNVWRQMSGIKHLKHLNWRQKSYQKMSPKSNVLALNVFDIKNLDVNHPASKVWATNVLGVKQLESLHLSQHHVSEDIRAGKLKCL